MRKFIILLLGFCVAGLAAWAVPREQKQSIKQEFTDVYQFSEVSAIAVEMLSIEKSADIAFVTARQSMTSTYAEIPAKTGLETHRYRWQETIHSFNTSTKIKANKMPDNLIDRRQARSNC